MKPTWRKPFGMILILVMITVWAWGIVSFSAEIGRLHVILQIIVFAITGILWIAPLKPLLLWMDQGKWRE
jgi:Protein of unknown function (DUF2842)